MKLQQSMILLCQIHSTFQMYVDQIHVEIEAPATVTAIQQGVDVDLDIQAMDVRTVNMLITT